MFPQIGGTRKKREGRGTHIQRKRMVRMVTCKCSKRSKAFNINEYGSSRMTTSLKRGTKTGGCNSLVAVIVRRSKSKVLSKTYKAYTYIHTYIHNKSYSAQSYTKQSDCALQMSKYSLHGYVKAMLKRCVFRARRKEGCESISPILTGRLFQISGPQTEKAQRPN